MQITNKLTKNGFWVWKKLKIPLRKDSEISMVYDRVADRMVNGDLTKAFQYRQQLS